MRRKSLYPILVLLLVVTTVRSGDLDSLYRNVELWKQKPASVQRDTALAKSILDFSGALYKVDLDSANYWAKLAYDLSERVKWRNGMALALNQLGYNFKDLGEYRKGISCGKKALKVLEEWEREQAVVDPVQLATLRSNNYTLIANSYKLLGEMANALEYYLLALEENKKIGRTIGVAKAMMMIGVLYNSFGEYQKAEKQFLEMLELCRKEEFKPLAVTGLGNLGLTYEGLGQIEKAIETHRQSMSLARETGDLIAEANAYNNIGVIYQDLGELDKARTHYEEALRLRRESGSYDISGELGNLGTVYKLLGEFSKAERVFLESIEVAEEIQALDIVEVFEEDLSQLYDTMGRYKEAYFHFKRFIAARDSLRNYANVEQQAKLMAKYEVEREKEIQAIQQKQKDEIAEQEKMRQQIITYSVALGLVLVIVILIIVFRSLRTSQRQKAIIEYQKAEVEQQKHLIEYQKEIVEEKQKEIIDSITYAKRLQHAILATEEEISSHLQENFLLYKPKDIVAGDFYFFETTPTHIFYAAADCTGHGVPGAMVSIVCSNALTRSVKEFDLSEPGKILDKTRELVVTTFEKSGQDVKDGMDISLIAIDRKTKEVKWSGANNPLWYIEEGEMKEITATKQPIGKVDQAKPFVTHTLTTGDSSLFLYLFTDGYADQFGGPKGKKFKYANMSKLLLDIHSLPLREQKSKLNQALETWRGDLEQVDDICVIGVRF